MLFRLPAPTLRLQWALLCSLLGLLTLIYGSLSRSTYPQAMLMPLDDSYIHFQYARQMAEGQPYRYNTDEAPSSGATSFLYTPLLALGYRLGFQGLHLGLWALGWGILAHLMNAWLVYRLISPQANWSGFGLACCYGVSGPFLWAALSGMETSLAVASLLLTLYAYQRQRDGLALLAASLAALIRPELAILTLTTVGAVWWREYRYQEPGRKLPTYLYLLALATIAVQPLVNRAVTGHSTANGTLAKSHLYNSTIPLIERLGLTLENYLRFWGEFITGGSEVDGWYLIPLLSLSAFAALLISLRASYKARLWTPGGLAALWIILIGAAIATLDTAFWHFKRYQLPVMALIFPLAGWLWVYAQTRLPRRDHALTVLLLACGLFSLWTSAQFALRYQANVELIARQQLAMADWVRVNLPADAVIGVHDVGVMRYRGGHTTYDVVGLTENDPQLARAWRQGSGTLYELMATSPKRPDFFAIYPDTAALPYLVGSGVMGEELARFYHPLSPDVVASATALQVVTLAEWGGVVTTPDLPPDLPLRQTLNIGDLQAEAQAGYHSAFAGERSGFASQAMRLEYRQCAQAPCQILDGVRAVTEEQFTVESPGPLTLLLRVHAANAARLRLGCGETAHDIAVIPELPGRWVNIAMTTDAPDGRVCIRSDAPYYSARYWVYAGQLPVIRSIPRFAPIRFSAPPAQAELELYLYSVEQTAQSLSLELHLFTTGQFESDGKLFIHLYTDLGLPPVAQTEDYLRADQAPANWLAGWMSDTFSLPLEGLAPGSYQLAIGFYDPHTGQRFNVQANRHSVDDGRVILQPIQIGG